MTHFIYAVLIGAVLGLSLLAEYYRGGRDDLAVWVVVVSAVVRNKDTTIDQKLSKLELLVLDEDDL